MMKINRNYFLVAQNAVLDSDNKLTLINIFDVFKAKKLPIHSAQLFFVANFDLDNVSKNDKQIRISYSIKSPSKKDIWNSPAQIINIDITNKKQSIGNISSVSGIVFPEYGEYKIDVLIDNKIVASTHLTVLKE